MLGLMAEHGPFYLETDGSLKPRKFAWTHTRSVIYLDSPVGTGKNIVQPEKRWSEIHQKL